MTEEDMRVGREILEGKMTADEAVARIIQKYRDDGVIKLCQAKKGVFKMIVCFTFEELTLMNCYSPENGRMDMISTLTDELPHMDELSASLTKSTIEKLHVTSDAEFDSLNLMAATNVFE